MGDGAREHRPTLGVLRARVCAGFVSEVKLPAVQAWRKLSETVAYERFRRILNRTFELPTGETADYEILDLDDSVAVLALTASNEVVLVEEFRPGPEAVLLELPGGLVEAGQAPLEAARLELLEETGYEGDLIEIGSVVKGAYSTNLKHVFAARNCRRVAEPDRPELTNPVLMPLEEFREHLRGGRLTDSEVAYRALDELGLL
jgi:ADP-ribose pyrophosphatase